MKIAPKQCISWKTCGGVEEFCTNCKTGDTSESICIYLPKMNEVQRFKLIEFTLTINSNSFYSTFIWGADFK